MSLEIYSDGDSFIYNPKDIDGFLLLNFNEMHKQIYYKFFTEKIDSNLSKLQDKQTAIKVYKLFHKHLTEMGEIEVICLSDLDDEDFTENETESIELNQFFGLEYYEETDILIIKDISSFDLL